MNGRSARGLLGLLGSTILLALVTGSVGIVGCGGGTPAADTKAAPTKESGDRVTKAGDDGKDAEDAAGEKSDDGGDAAGDVDGDVDAEADAEAEADADGADEGGEAEAEAEAAGDEAGDEAGDDAGADGGDEGGDKADPAALLKEVKSKRTKDDRAEEALKLAEDAGAEPRDLAKAAKARGDALFATPERAAKFYQWAADKDPKYPDATFALAKQAATTGEIDETKKLLEEVKKRGGKKLLQQIDFDPMWDIVKDDPDVRALLQ